MGVTKETIYRRVCDSCNSEIAETGDYILFDSAHATEDSRVFDLECYEGMTAKELVNILAVKDADDNPSSLDEFDIEVNIGDD